MKQDFYYKFILPDNSIADFVENIGMFHNQSNKAKEIILMPDGRIDLICMQTGLAPFQITLIGLETVPEQTIIPPHTLAFKVSFKPLGVEYILQTSIADLLNSAKKLPKDFWDINTEDFKEFDAFMIL